jgi:hypothetical protein
MNSLSTTKMPHDKTPIIRHRILYVSPSQFLDDQNHYDLYFHSHHQVPSSIAFPPWNNTHSSWTTHYAFETWLHVIVQEYGQASDYHVPRPYHTSDDIPHQRPRGNRVRRRGVVIFVTYIFRNVQGQTSLTFMCPLYFLRSVQGIFLGGTGWPSTYDQTILWYHIYPVWTYLVFVLIPIVCLDRPSLASPGVTLFLTDIGPPGPSIVYEWPLTDQFRHWPCTHVRLFLLVPFFKFPPAETKDFWRNDQIH